MLERAQRSFAWYLGDNSHRECLIDGETGGFCDSINRNQGAESIVGFCIANLALEKCEVPAGGKRRPCSTR